MFSAPTLPDPALSKNCPNRGRNRCRADKKQTSDADIKQGPALAPSASPVARSKISSKAGVQMDPRAWRALLARPRALRRGTLRRRPHAAKLTARHSPSLRRLNHHLGLARLSSGVGSAFPGMQLRNGRDSFPSRACGSIASRRSTARRANLGKPDAPFPTGMRQASARGDHQPRPGKNDFHASAHRRIDGAADGCLAGRSGSAGHRRPRFHHPMLGGGDGELTALRGHDPRSVARDRQRRAPIGGCANISSSKGCIASAQRW